MNIGEMHVTFRELAQQMGMQTVRAILMEDIDICLNAAIIEKARNVIVENVGPVPYNDKVARQNASISPVNALRTYTQRVLLTAEILQVVEQKLTLIKLTLIATE